MLNSSSSGGGQEVEGALSPRLPPERGLLPGKAGRVSQIGGKAGGSRFLQLPGEGPAILRGRGKFHLRFF